MMIFRNPISTALESCREQQLQGIQQSEHSSRGAWRCAPENSWTAFPPASHAFRLFIDIDKSTSVPLNRRRERNAGLSNWEYEEKRRLLSARFSSESTFRRSRIRRPLRFGRCTKATHWMMPMGPQRLHLLALTKATRKKSRRQEEVTSSTTVSSPIASLEKKPKQPKAGFAAGRDDEP